MKCGVEGCLERYDSRGYCKRHATALRRYGSPTAAPGKRGAGKNKTIGCSMEGCPRPHKGRGLCNTHYRRWTKHGDPAVDFTHAPKHGLTVDQRFWAKVAVTDGCWLWLASKRFGYGWFKDERGVDRPAHRWCYERYIAPVPPYLQMDHLCRTPACVRWDHLEPVTQKENVRRGMAPSIISWRQRTCKRGHPFDIIRSDGGSGCSICNAIRYRNRCARLEASKKTATSPSLRPS